MLNVPKKINWRSSYFGMDCIEKCFDRQHFLNYSKKINYEYNSKGFRDKEWPEDLSDVIWCVGDSFTVGIGQPFKETWPQLLEKKIRKRCLNLGEDGCSNDTISLRSKEIFKLCQPKLLIVMWSYFHRRRINGQDILSDKNSFGSKEDIKNFLNNFEIVNTLPTKVIHLLIPNSFIDIDKWSRKKLEYIFTKSNLLTYKQVKDILTFPQLDRARDYHHFDVKTSKHICDLIFKKINNFDKISK